LQRVHMVAACHGARTLQPTNRMPLGMYAACVTRHVRGLSLRGCTLCVASKRATLHGGPQRVEHPRTITPALPIEDSAHPGSTVHWSAWKAGHDQAHGSEALVPLGSEAREMERAAAARVDAADARARLLANEAPAVGRSRTNRTNKQTNKTNKQTNKSSASERADKQTSRRTNTHANKQTNTQTSMQTHTQTNKQANERAKRSAPEALAAEPPGNARHATRGTNERSCGH
jgi:hypothetical protein